MTSVLCSNAANVSLDAGGNNSAGGVCLPLMPFCTTFQAPEVVVVVVLVVAAAVLAAAAVRAVTLVTAAGSLMSFLVGEFLVPEATDRPPEETTWPTVALSLSILLLLLLGVSSRLEPINTRPEGSRVGDDPKLEIRGLSKRLLPLALLLLDVWSGAGAFSMKKERLFMAVSRLFARAGGRLLLAPLRAGGRLDDDALGLLGQSRAR